MAQAEELYGRALAANPGHSFSLYNYAVLLEDVRHDFDKAEEVRAAHAAAHKHAQP